jgi:hypothetical protein
MVLVLGVLVYFRKSSMRCIEKLGFILSICLNQKVV